MEVVLNYMEPREKEACSCFKFLGEKVQKNKRIIISSFTWLISAMECQIQQGKVAYQAADLLNVFQIYIASFKFNGTVILNTPYSNLILPFTNHWKI